jgi:hypothetical protein
MTTRAGVFAEAVGEALDILNGEDADSDEDESDLDEEDSDEEGA